MNQHAKRRYQAGLRSLAPVEPAPPVVISEEPVEVPAMIGQDGGDILLTVEPEEAGERLDRFVAAKVASPALSRTRLKNLIEIGTLSVDGKVTMDAGTKIRAGQVITIHVPAALPAEPEGENIPLNVVFEDEHLIIIDKPPGLVVHPAAGHETGTLVNALIAHCGATLSGIGGVKRPGIVHRLDKDTSGLLVVAKTDAAHQGLSALFADHGRTLSLTREYLAIVWCGPGRPAGLVNAPLGRHAHHREKQAIVSDARGREAITHFGVEFTYGTPPLVSLVRCHLETGRTHQIRVHMASLGCPVVCDDLYGSGFKTKGTLMPAEAQAAMRAMGRQALHATTLGFTHPVSGEEMMFESPLPADMQAFMSSLSAD